MRQQRLRGLIAVFGLALATPTAVMAGDGGPALLRFDDSDHGATTDRGPPPRPAPTAALAKPQAAAVPAGGVSASSDGMFGPVVGWPIIPIHAVLLPDGRVMTYGTNQTGQQGAALVYDVWDPALGTGAEAHMVLPNTTGTDIFCSAQSVLWGSDEVLISGGDLTIDRKRNFSQNATTIFSPQSNSIAAGAPMQYPRWYASMVAQPNGEMLVLGGRTAATTAAITPEVFDPATGWRTLTGATSNAAFKYGNAGWFYPRGFVAPDGSVFILGADGQMFSLTTAGTGSITALRQTTLAGTEALPTVMFAPGQLLSLRAAASTVVIDLNGAAPVVTQAGKISQDRLWANATVLPDGRVLVTGGSLVANTLTGVADAAELWTPATGQWTLAASAAKPRLYHSTALLLPDATVLTGGGGAPGPINQLNAEIYYPSYLYDPNGSGQPAARPTLVDAPAVVTVGQTFTATVGPADVIASASLVRAGSVTHSTNLDQRFVPLAFSQTGATLTVDPPASDTILLPGDYMLFVFNAAGTPSLAAMVLVRD